MVDRTIAIDFAIANSITMRIVYRFGGPRDATEVREDARKFLTNMLGSTNMRNQSDIGKMAEDAVGVAVHKWFIGNPDILGPEGFSSYFSAVFEEKARAKGTTVEEAEENGLRDYEDMKLRAYKESADARGITVAELVAELEKEKLRSTEELWNILTKQGQEHTKTIQLVAPDGSNIVGFLSKSGATRSFECKYIFGAGEHHFFHGIPKSDWGETADFSGDIVFVDANGNYWLGADVQNASIPHRA
jgi:hypothetical protein